MKNLRLIPLALLLFFSTAIIVSCNREADLVPEKGPSGAALSTVPDYSSIGEMHNQVLAGLAADEDFPAFILSEDKSSLAAKTAALTRDVTGCGAACANVNMPQIALNGLTTVNAVGDLEGLADLMYENELITANDKAEFYRLHAACAYTNSDPAALKQRLLDFEASVAAMTTLSESGQRALLIGSTVMRYSTDFWTTVQNNGPGDPWYELEKDRTDDILPGVAWWERDLVGAGTAALTPGTWMWGPQVGIGISVLVGAIGSAG